MARWLLPLLLLVACGSSSPAILAPTSAYPCGSPLYAWCPGNKTCCDASDEVCLMQGTGAGMCEDINEGGNGIDGKLAPRTRRPQVEAVQ